LTAALTLILAAPLFYPDRDVVVEGVEGDDSIFRLGIKDDWQIWGGPGEVGFGKSMATGDLDNDGKDDLIVGLPDSELGEGGGMALIYFARSMDDLFPLWGPEDADVIVYGEDRDDHFGHSVLAEDLNGDGWEDLIISAPFADGPADDRRDCGEVYVLNGRTRLSFGITMDVGEDTLDGHISGRDTADHLGMKLLAGKLDQDGISDLVILNEGAGGSDDGGASGDNNNIGSWEVEVIAGNSSDLGNVDLSVNAPLTRFYGSLTLQAPLNGGAAKHVGEGLAVGDHNGDGYDDLAMTFLSETEGAVCLYLGGPDFPPSGSGVTITVPDDSDLTILLGEDGSGKNSLAMGDIDGDDDDEILVGMTGAPGFDEWRYGAGQVDMYLGSDFTSPVEHNRDDANWTLFGEDSSDGLGYSLLFLDNDGDSMDEIFVGTPLSDGYRNQYDNSGEGYGFDIEGPVPRHSNVTGAVLKIMGGGPGWSSFTAIGSMDMDMDGTEDLLISSPGASSDVSWGANGLISVLMGNPVWEGRFYGNSGLSGFGSVVKTHDIDEDGYIDIMISAPKEGFDNSGKVYLYFGDEEGFSGYYFAEESADVVYNHERDDQYLGGDLAFGDLNDDGRQDILISSPMYYTWPGEGGYGVNAGVTWFVWGDTRENLTSERNVELAVGANDFIRGERTIESGSSLAVGDFNGDGVDDLAIGAPAASARNRHHCGRVFIFLGPITFTSDFMMTAWADVIIDGHDQNAAIGSELSVGDIDGDGLSELVIGAPRDSPGSVKGAGAVHVLKGRASWPAEIDLYTENRLRIDGEWPYDALGLSTHVADLDSDGLDDVIMGAPISGGYQRQGHNRGAAYVLFGSHLGSRLDDNVIRLREGANITIYGSSDEEQFGYSFSTGLIDNNTRRDLIVGAKDSVNPNVGLPTGRAFIFFTLDDMQDLVMTSSSLAFLATSDEDDLTGYDIACGDMNNDGLDDLLIGAPGNDPEGSDAPRGAVFLWISKDLFFSDFKAFRLSILEPDMVGSGTRYSPYICPGAGPYDFLVGSRSTNGVDLIEGISLVFRMQDGSGEVEFSYDPSSDGFSKDSVGVFDGRVSLLTEQSTSWTEGLDVRYASFKLDFDWDCPRPDMVLTRLDHGSGYNMNFDSTTFGIDREVSFYEDTIDVTDGEGWLNGTSVFSVVNVTLLHGMTGRPISTGDLENIRLGLFRPDGLLIRNGTLEGERIHFINATPGQYISGRQLGFYIGATAIPEGAVWRGNLSIPLDVDSRAPGLVSSFRVYPDGDMQEPGYVDDDPLVEVRWEELPDIGDSGIDRNELTILFSNGTVHSVLDDVHPGDHMVLPEGDINLSIRSIDNARNIGPSIEWRITIDQTAPTLLNFNPSSGSWISEENLDAYIEVKDEGSGVDPESAMYRIYRSDALELTNWKPAIGVQNIGGTQMLYAQPNLPEGRGHYVQWSVSDKAGQQTLSDVVYYNVDRTPPSIEVDSTETFYDRSEIELSCIMEDPLSGIDLDTVSYRVGRTQGFWDLPWEGAGLSGAGAVAYPRVTVFPSFTGYGYIQWRATDMAENLAETGLRTIYVDSILPEFTTFEPNSSSVQTKRSVQVSVFVLEGESGIGPNDIEVSYSTISGWVQYGVGGYSPWMELDSVEEAELGLFKGTVQLLLDEGPFNLVRFRVRDQAGNGWVVSSPQTVRVELKRENLPPIPVMVVIPNLDVLDSGTVITLDGSNSRDPEGLNLTYRWYSDLENYPGNQLLGEGERLDVQLDEVGVHHLWLEVSDGRASVSSEQTSIRVRQVVEEEDEEGSSSEEGLGMCDIIPIMALVLIIGGLIGSIIALFVVKRLEQRREGPVLLSPGDEGYPTVETEYIPPECPYCGSEVRPTDTYCMECGAAFTDEDMETIRGAEPPSGKRSRRSKLEKGSTEPMILPPILEERSEEDMEDIDDIFMVDRSRTGAPGDEVVELEEEPVEFEEEPEPPELEDIVEVEELDDEELDWEVEP